MTAFIRAVTKDPDLAIAWFQLSVCNFLLGEFEEAALNANECYAKMRGNPVIDYQQLGLDHKLHSCEVLYNRGICSIYDGAEEEGIEDLIWAAEAVTLDEHKAIREAIEAKGKVRHSPRSWSCFRSLFLSTAPSSLSAPETSSVHRNTRSRTSPRLTILERQD